MHTLTTCHCVACSLPAYHVRIPFLRHICFNYLCPNTDYLDHMLEGCRLRRKSSKSIWAIDMRKRSSIIELVVLACQQVIFWCLWCSILGAAFLIQRIKHVTWCGMYVHWPGDVQSAHYCCWCQISRLLSINWHNNWGLTKARSYAVKIHWSQHARSGVVYAWKLKEVALCFHQGRLCEVCLIETNDVRHMLLTQSA